MSGTVGQKAFYRHPDLANYSHQIAGTKVKKKGASMLFNRDFKLFYYCFLIGVKHEYRVKYKADELQAFYKYFPEDFNSNEKFQIIALLISAYMEDTGLKLSKKEDLEEIMDKLLDVNSGEFLSEEGFKRINEYALGGFLKLKETYQYPEENVFKGIEKILDLLL